MKKWVLIAGAFALAAAGRAFAADIPQPAPQPPATYVPTIEPAYSWTGFYIGANAGYGLASAAATGTLTGNVYGLDGTTSASRNLDGLIAGAQIGANWQINSFVLGAEVDGDWSDQNWSETLGCGIDCTISGIARVEWFGTARLRAGYAIDRLLLYATGGGAMVDASDRLNSTAGTVTTNWLSASNAAFGWTIGAGLEYAFLHNVTGKVEYLYLQAKPKWSGSFPPALGGGSASESATIDSNIIRAGINLKFP